MPRADIEMPLLTLFTLSNFSLVFLSCAMTVFVLRLYYLTPTFVSTSSYQMPYMMRLILFKYIAKLFLLNFHFREQNDLNCEIVNNLMKKQQHHNNNISNKAKQHQSNSIESDENDDDDEDDDYEATLLEMINKQDFNLFLPEKEKEIPMNNLSCLNNDEDDDQDNENGNDDDDRCCQDMAAASRSKELESELNVNNLKSKQQEKHIYAKNLEKLLINMRLLNRTLKKTIKDKIKHEDEDERLLTRNDRYNVNNARNSVNYINMKLISKLSSANFDKGSSSSIWTVKDKSMSNQNFQISVDMPAANNNNNNNKSSSSRRNINQLTWCCDAKKADESNNNRPLNIQEKLVFYTEWKQAALIIDRIFFFIFLISMPLTVVAFFRTDFIGYVMERGETMEDVKNHCNW